MDPLSQFAVGAVVGGALAPRVLRALRRQQNQPVQALPVGASILCAGLAAMTPDLDVLIRNADYPLLTVKYHRHFTHALALVPLYALLLTPLAWLLFRRTGITALAAFVLCLLGLLTHGPLDAMTNYGTHLFWPFTNARESWSIISIVDPIFTLTLVAALLLAAIKKTRRPLLLACAFMLLYWGAGLYQRTAAEQAMQQLAESRGHTVQRFEVKPAFANIIVWRAQYIHDNKIYTDAINMLPFRAPKVYAGSSVPLLVVDDVWLQRLPAPAQEDVRDFVFFSDGWVANLPTENGEPPMIGDMRFAMLPNENKPLWALQLQPLPSGRLPFMQLPRDAGQDNFDKLWAMVRGE